MDCQESLTPSALGALPLFGGSTVARFNRVIAATTTRSFNTASFSQLAVDKEASAQRTNCPEIETCAVITLVGRWDRDPQESMGVSSPLCA